MASVPPTAGRPAPEVGSGAAPSGLRSSGVSSHRVAPAPAASIGGSAPPDRRADDRVGAVFAALADPTRRAILRAVAERGTAATATEVSGAVGVTRQAVTKHLDLLAEAGLVADTRTGRERRWRVTPSPLADAAWWLERTGTAWDARLARLAEAATSSPPPPAP